jgi:hypothetical protein
MEYYTLLKIPCQLLKVINWELKICDLTGAWKWCIVYQEECVPEHSGAADFSPAFEVMRALAVMHRKPDSTSARNN